MRISGEDPRERKYKDPPEKTEKRSSTKRSEIQRIRERIGGKSWFTCVFSYAKAQKIQTFFFPIVV